MELSSITPDVAGLRALSHPVRLRLLGLLRSDGPATATALAQRLGVNSGATSYHLRQLAQHGFIEDDAHRGSGRERWWRATSRSTTTDEPDEQTAAEVRDSLDAYLQSVAVVHTEKLQRAVEERGLLPHAWRRATTTSDWHVRLTPQRARELVERLEALIEGVAEQPDDPDAAEVVFQLHAFPRPGTLVEGPGNDGQDGDT